MYRHGQQISGADGGVIVTALSTRRRIASRAAAGA
jgi:hypothetical protein